MNPLLLLYSVKEVMLTEYKSVFRALRTRGFLPVWLSISKLSSILTSQHQLCPKQAKLNNHSPTIPKQGLIFKISS